MRIMGLYEVDISRILCTDKPTNRHIVYSDLKFMIKQADIYTPPVVRPAEKKHFRVVQNPESFFACWEVGKKHVVCDIPSEFEKSVEAEYHFPHPPERQEWVSFFFYNRPPKPFPDLSDEIRWFTEVHGAKALNLFKLHPEVSGIELHFSPDAENLFCLWNNVVGLSYGFGKRLGCPLRSINGRR